MADGRFGCGRVLRVDTDRPTGGRTRFIAAIVDWVGDSRPTSEAIAGSPVLNVGNAHVRLVSFGGGAILGERPLSADGIEAPETVNSYWGDGCGVARAERRFIAGDPRGLRSLDLKLGGTCDLRLLPRVGELWYLELSMIRGLTDVSSVGRISSRGRCSSRRCARSRPFRTSGKPRRCAGCGSRR